ncbi:unnamed protein product, partial [Ectocarpus sp. 4 AP-2014]
RFITTCFGTASGDEGVGGGGGESSGREWCRSRETINLASQQSGGGAIKGRARGESRHGAACRVFTEPGKGRGAEGKISFIASPTGNVFGRNLCRSHEAAPLSCFAARPRVMR